MLCKCPTNRQSESRRYLRTSDWQSIVGRNGLISTESPASTIRPFDPASAAWVFDGPNPAKIFRIRVARPHIHLLRRWPPAGVTHDNGVLEVVTCVIEG